MNISDITALVKDKLALLEEELKKNLDSDVEMVNEVAYYVFESGGKRLRPIFMFLSSGLGGYTGNRDVILSGVVEYIHTATLLHDDVIDGAKFRRGRPSANQAFGNDITVLCGDFLYSRAFVNLVKDGDPKVQMILANAAKTMSEGEVFQLVKTANFNLSFEEYNKIIFSKTAVLFSACCEIGAMLAGFDGERVKMMAEFGKIVGLSFQMSDDILDYLGDPAKTGKKPGTDLKEGKMTLPMLLLRDLANESELMKMKDIIASDPDENDITYIIDLMERYDVKSKAESFVDSYTKSARDLLSSFPDNEYRRALEFLSEYVILRDR
ncbi:polyprenyl synthetase family protein [Calditerrivibrio nitroreducens]|uniref:Polyprenyl synthetase n=1 Tax=Calditerrivibrio nitroreducens (strain DSM 19672 / NBRC 101217 / Yu37-1) TaxID=768670 RepID=E4TFK6_CALNY|nr:polyprenyl synthetase family protein [Calditerrivibrio nitroreducens]ADR18474.1 Polyprenyl synthetase [Calditerrivibrio nitroreducens DSM 19672]